MAHYRLVSESLNKTATVPESDLSRGILERILTTHGVRTMTKWGNLYAWSTATRTDTLGRVADVSRYVDVTGWTANALYQWLGY